MGASEDRDKLSGIIKTLQAKFNGIDIHTLDTEEQIQPLVDEIVDVNVQVQQFKTRHGVDDWKSWGHKLWSDVERTWTALERKLSRISAVKLDEEKNFQRKMTVVTVACAVVSTVAACVSIYFSMNK